MNAGSVPYPEGASGEAVVVLELLVSDAGFVRDAHVVSGDEPFAGASLTAAYSWSFTPAHRGDVAVAARIRMRVEFHPPPVVEEHDAGAGDAGAPVADAGPKKQSGVEDVLVRGKRVEVGGTRLGSGEVRQIPGAFGDAFRALEALPGVTPIVSGLPFFFVRGAPPGNTGYFLDGVRVPLLYHLALGPSVIHPGLIDSVEFYPGGYPARYGRFAGGILDGQTLPPARKVHGEANIRVFDAGALIEAPLLDGKLTVLAAGRYSYTAAVVQLVAKDTRIAYWDYQTRVSYKLTPRDRISLFWFGSYDEIDNRDRSPLTGSTQGEIVGPFYPIFKTEFHTADLRYDHDTRGGHVRLAATLGLEDSIAGDSSSNTTFRVASANTVEAKNFRLRAEGEERLSDVVKVRYGADSVLTHYALEPAFATSDPNGLYPDRNDVVVGAYGDAVWKASPRVEVIPGMRFDIFTSRLVPDQRPKGYASLTNAVAQVGVDPRLATRVATGKWATWITTFGVSHQPPSLLPIPGLEVGRLNTGLQTSIQASQGVEVKLPLDFTATSTVFLHDYIGLTDVTATCLNLNGTSVPNDFITNNCLDARVRGRSFGLELLVKRDLTKRFTGWLAYTLSRSTREAHAITSFDPGRTNPLQQSIVTIPSEFDRTHVLNLMGAMNLGAGWRAGARFLFYTGRPYSQTVTIKNQQIALPPYNTERMPPFFRVDVRLEKRWRVFGTGSIAVVLEGMNVSFTKEAIAVECKTTPGSIYDTCTPVFIGPISAPSIGVEGSF